MVLRVLEVVNGWRCGGQRTSGGAAGRRETFRSARPVASGERALFAQNMSLFFVETDGDIAYSMFALGAIPV